MATTEQGAGSVRAGFAIDSAALDGWLTRHVPGYRGPLGIAQFAGGQSNPTYRLTAGDRSYVLRKPPPGQLLKGAHAVDREARVLQALANAGFPVPHVHALCTDESVIGTPFYVMDMVQGRIFWDPALPDIPRDARAAYFDAMNATIAALHAVDPATVGLADFGRPSGYVARQIALWTRQYQSDPDAGHDPAMDRLIEWLPRHCPEDGTCRVIHGDFRLDNMIFHPFEPRVIAVLDWELSTLGDPRADFAYHLMMYRMPPTVMKSLYQHDVDALGLPSESDYVAAYEARIGCELTGDLDFFLAFNFFRLAAITHGIKGRVLRGTAVGTEAVARSQHVPSLAQVAWSHAVRAGAGE